MILKENLFSLNCVKRNNIITQWKNLNEVNHKINDIPFCFNKSLRILYEVRKNQTNSNLRCFFCLIIT